MTTAYNAREIFQIGVDIEKNGKKFYETFAQSTDNTAVRALCIELAEWENKHVSLFEGLMSQLPSSGGEAPVIDPDNEAELYLKAAADSHIFTEKNYAATVANVHSPADILATALAFEKDSVVVYTTMMKMVPENLGKRHVEKIIDEELKHIAIISKKIGELGR